MKYQADLSRSIEFRNRLAAKSKPGRAQAARRTPIVYLGDEPAAADAPMKATDFYPAERKKWAGPVAVGVVAGLFLFPIAAIALK